MMILFIVFMVQPGNNKGNKKGSEGKFQPDEEITSRLHANIPAIGRKVVGVTVVGDVVNSGKELKLHKPQIKCLCIQGRSGGNNQAFPFSFCDLIRVAAPNTENSTEPGRNKYSGVRPFRSKGV